MALPHLKTLRLVTVPDESHMLTLGEVRDVALDYVLFNEILEGGSADFGVVNVGDWKTIPRGTLLSILNVSNILPDVQPKIEVECRCSGRFDVTLQQQVAPPVWTLLSARCNDVKDWMVYEYDDRVQLAAKEWAVWNSCRQVSSLLRQVHKPVSNEIAVEQQLAVWAPKGYDGEILEEEWRQTPIVTRRVYCERAESFSFGVLRCMDADENMMSRARGMTNTLQRLHLAEECVELKRARTQAQLSLKNAFDGEGGSEV